MAEINRFKLEWACRRGMRELDKMIMPFYQKPFQQPQLKPDNRHSLKCSLTQNPELFRWVMHQLPAPTQAITDVIELMRSKIENNREAIREILSLHFLLDSL